MAKGNFPACLAVTLPHEGGYSNHPRDPGGATMKGITLATFRKYYPDADKADLRSISDKDVERIYRVGYWGPIRGEQLPAGVDLAVFDYGVNSGPSRAAKALQASVGASVDGKVGLQTVTAANSRDPVATVQAVCARRLSFLRGLGTFSTFGRGWTKRVADVEAKGVVMAGASRAVVRAEADKAAKAGNDQAKVATGTGAAGAGGGGFEIASGDVNWLLVFGVIAVAIVVVSLVKSRSNINKARAAAYAKVAA